MRLDFSNEFVEILNRFDRGERILIAKTLQKLSHSDIAVGKPLRAPLAALFTIRTGTSARLRLIYSFDNGVAKLLHVGVRSDGLVYQEVARMLKDSKR